MKKNSSFDNISESELIKLLLNSDAAAFDYLVKQYHSLMLSIARAIVGEAFADEVVQDAWVSAINALPNFEQRSSLKTWLLNIASNGAKTRLRKESRKLSLDDNWESVPADKFDARGHRLDDVLPWELDTPEALLENVQLQRAIENCFQTLPANQRAVITMFDMEGYEIKEICNFLALSASNVRVLLHRARTTLHHTIEKYQDGQTNVSV